MRILLISLMVLVLVSCGQQKSAEKYFEQGAQCFEQGQYDKAIELYQQGVQIAPKSAIGYNLLGMVYRFKFNQTNEQQWREKEISSFEKAIEHDPNHMPALINLGATYFYSGEKEKAVPYFKHALEVYPEHPEAEEIRKMINEVEGLD